MNTSRVLGFDGGLIENATFDDDSWWTLHADVTVADGVAKVNGTNGAKLTSPDLLLTVGVTYDVTYTISNMVPGVGARTRCGGTNGTKVTTNGTYNEQILCSVSRRFYIYATQAGGNQFHIDDISVSAV